MNADLEKNGRGVIGNGDVPVISIGVSATSRPASLLVAAGSRILGEALADVLTRAGYEVHLAPPGCHPGAVVAEARAVRPELVLLDLPTAQAAAAMADAIEEISREMMRIVVLGPDSSVSRRAAGIPVDEWASRADSLNSLVDKVQRCAPSGSAPRTTERRLRVSPTASHHKINEAGSRQNFDLLTSREQQVLVALMNGTPAVTIARQAFMSPSTVRHHIRSILSKLNVNTQLAAVVAAYQAGWPASRVASIRSVDSRIAEARSTRRAGSCPTREAQVHDAAAEANVQGMYR